MRTATLLVLCFLVQATVTRVIDGDTFEARLRVFLDEERTARVRVLDVDAVELREPGGREARAFTERWLTEAGRGPVMVHACGYDAFGRVLGHVVRDGRRLADDLRSAGYAR